MRKTSVERKIITVKMLILVSCIIMGFLCLKLWNINFKKTETVANNKMYEIYIETGFGTDTYTTYTSNVFPTEGYVLNTSLTTCIGGGTISQESSFINAIFNSSDSCKLYFDVDNSQAGVTGVATILNLVGDADDTSTAIIEGTELAYDGTTDKNLRYVGYDGTNNKPNNYIDIGDTSSLWRIIGVFNNIDDGTGISETRLKIMRDKPISYKGTDNYEHGYSWDSSANTINHGYGINQWGPSGSYEGADLMRELNGDYLNTNLTANTSWYSGIGNNTGVFDISNVLSAAAQELIGEALWHTGAISTSKYTTSKTSSLYQDERGTVVASKNCNIASYCNDTVVRTTTWVGKIALPYVSDYGFATAGSNEISREECLNSVLRDWWCDEDDDDDEFCSCIENTWINEYTLNNKNNPRMWTITPNSDSPYMVLVISDDEIGLIADYVYEGYANYIIIPTAFLKSNVVIVGGTGTKTDPYIAALP